MKTLNKLRAALSSGINSFKETLLEDNKQTCQHERVEEEKAVYDTPTAIYCGWSDHDCATNYKCSVCSSTFDSWSLYHNKNDKCCPHCKTPLSGL